MKSIFLAKAKVLDLTPRLSHKRGLSLSPLVKSAPGADFTNGLKPGFGLKFKTLVLNSVKNVLRQRA